MTTWPWPSIASLSIVRSESLSSTRRMESGTLRIRLAQPAGRHVGAPRLVFDLGERFSVPGDIGLDAVLLGDGAKPFLFDQRPLSRVTHIYELGIHPVNLALQRIGERLTASKRVARGRKTIAPELLVLRRIRRGRRGWFGAGCRRGFRARWRGIGRRTCRCWRCLRRHGSWRLSSIGTTQRLVRINLYLPLDRLTARFLGLRDVGEALSGQRHRRHKDCRRRQKTLEHTVLLIGRIRGPLHCRISCHESTRILGAPAVSSSRRTVASSTLCAP